MTPAFPARALAHRAMTRRAPAARALRGVGLVEALVALLMLMVGVLGVAAMQTALVGQVTTSQQRLAAQALADEILSLALVDERNASCYTWPAAGACTSGAALAALGAWRERASTTLALAQDPVLALDADGQLAVRLSWHGKDASHVHQLETRTHVLP